MELCEYEVQVLRVAAGEEVADLCWGGAMGQALEVLKGRRLVEQVGLKYVATALGRQWLSARALESSAG